jgi:ABC-2 type transport system ATP-binding protein
VDTFETLAKREGMHISIESLGKIYENGKPALKDINLEVPNGMFGLLGPNGAGKTTLIRILVTLLEPTSGRVLVNGADLQKERRNIRAMLGYLPQEFRFFSRLKTWEFLDYIALLAGMKNRAERRSTVDRMLTQVGLFEARDRMANRLSGGMKRRLGIAQALIGDPQIVVIDEPTTGLDPEERIRFRNLISALGRQDIIILFSTHIVGDISSTCRNLALLRNGKVAYCGTPDELLRRAQGHVWRIAASSEELETIRQRHTVVNTVAAVNGWEVEVVAERLDGFEGTAVQPDLEHAYVYFMEKQETGRNL